MTTTTLSELDLEHMWSLLVELDRAGHTEEARALARAYAVAQEVVYADLLAALDDDDPEFVRVMDAAERDIAANRLIAHDDVVRRLQALEDA